LRFGLGLVEQVADQAHSVATFPFKEDPFAAIENLAHDATDRWILK
jgi:hypothetical protein